VDQNLRYNRLAKNDITKSTINAVTGILALAVEIPFVAPSPRR